MYHYFNDDSSFSDTFSRRHFLDITQDEKDDAIEYVLGRFIPISLTQELYNYIDQQIEEFGVCILSDNTLYNILSKYGFKISARIGSKSVIISRHGLIKN